ncbi:MAG TPA: hypothetical protein VD860_17135 [Azospirillum sp.]|nr:hypothetical protein [Azospirillum sp.]
MPRRDRRQFDPARARRILRLLGWSAGELRRQYNDKTGAHAHPPDVSAWLSGRRTIPDAAVVLLKSAVRCARVKRGRAPL